MGKNKKDFDFFDMFVRAVSHSEEAANMLQEILEKFDPDTLPDRIKDMHTVEHTADIAKHDMMNELAHAFITPIEREDILLLIQEIDNVTDSIEDVLLRMYMFNVLSVREEALEFTALLVQCCKALREALKDLRHFRKSSSLYENIVEVNRLEEEGDTLYTRAVRRLYMTSKDPVEMMAWREIFDRMEKCCDACEHVANAMESVIMKNS